MYKYLYCIGMKLLKVENITNERKEVVMVEIVIWPFWQPLVEIEIW